jgi:hypothetical protein
MKKIYTVLTLLLAGSLSTFSQSPAWNWAKKISGQGTEIITALCTGNDGYIYVTGRFDTSSISIVDTTLNSNDSQGQFLCKLSTTGDVIWISDLNDSNDITISDIFVDASGNIFLTGSFKNDISLGSIFIQNSSNDVNTRDFFLLKLNNLGNPIWCKSASAGGGGEYGTKIAVDSNGNIFVVGSFVFTFTMDFGVPNFYNTTIQSNSSEPSFFLAKYDSLGTIKWARGEYDGGTGGYGIDVVIDSQNNVYLLGTFRDEDVCFTDFNCFPNSQGNNNSQDCFIVKYSNNGDFLRYNGIVGVENQDATAMAIDSQNNIYITGTNFGPNASMGNFNLQRISQASDIYITKINSQGNFLWAKSFWGTTDVLSTDLSLAQSNAIFLTGIFSDSIISYDGNSFSNNDGGASHIFLLRLNADGQVQWVKSPTGSSSENPNEIATDPQGNVFLAGRFGSTSSNSTIEFDSNTLICSDALDSYLAKLNDDLSSNLLDIKQDISNPEIYPNPSSGTLTISYPSLIKKGNLQVYNSLGNLIIEESLKNFNQTSITLTTTGVYFIRINSDGNLVTKKLIVTK